MKRDGKYTVQRKQQGKCYYEEIIPQPFNDPVLVMKRYSTALKRNKTYKKRVTWFTNIPSALDTHKSGKSVCIVEYVGTYPDTNRPHGNCKKVGHDYVSTRKQVITEIKARVQHKNPRQVYAEMIQENSMMAPRSFNQVRNFKQATKKKEMQGDAPCKNVADEVERLIHMQKDSDFIKRIIHDCNKIPTVILHHHHHLVPCLEDVLNHLPVVPVQSHSHHLSHR